jgi:glycosyltransferase involved in cell wall biosynthesis
VKISIVTVNYNDAAGLDKTIRSIFDQSYSAIEHVVVDGGSTDESMDVIDKWRDHLDGVISEPDQGIYDAQNKGIPLTSGSYLLFLNAGDFLVSPEVIEKFAGASDGSDLLFGSLVVRKPGGECFLKEPIADARLQLIADTLWHPCTFISRELIESEGGYRDSQYRIAADYEFLLRSVFRRGASFMRLDFPVAEFNLDGISSDPSNWSNVVKEKKRAVRENLCISLMFHSTRYRLFRKICRWKVSRRIIQFTFI